MEGQMNCLWGVLFLVGFPLVLLTIIQLCNYIEYRMTDWTVWPNSEYLANGREWDKLKALEASGIHSARYRELCAKQYVNDCPKCELGPHPHRDLEMLREDI
jgi:hypothetical protein